MRILSPQVPCRKVCPLQKCVDGGRAGGNKRRERLGAAVTSQANDQANSPKSKAGCAMIDSISTSWLAWIAILSLPGLGHGTNRTVYHGWTREQQTAGPGQTGFLRVVPVIEAAPPRQGGQGRMGGLPRKTPPVIRRIEGQRADPPESGLELIDRVYHGARPVRSGPVSLPNSDAKGRAGG